MIFGVCCLEGYAGRIEHVSSEWKVQNTMFHVVSMCDSSRGHGVGINSQRGVGGTSVAILKRYMYIEESHQVPSAH